MPDPPANDLSSAFLGHMLKNQRSIRNYIFSLHPRVQDLDDLVQQPAVPPPPLASLLSRLVDGTLDAAGTAKLLEILRHSPEARAYYRHYLATHLDLAEAMQESPRLTVAIHDGRHLRLYIDGALSSEVPATEPSPGDSLRPIIGRLQPDTRDEMRDELRQYTGVIDEVALYGGVLGQDEIQTHAAALGK